MFDLFQKQRNILDSDFLFPQNVYSFQTITRKKPNQTSWDLEQHRSIFGLQEKLVNEVFNCQVFNCSSGFKTN